MGVKKRNCIKKNTIPTGKLNQSLPYYNVVPLQHKNKPLGINHQMAVAKIVFLFYQALLKEKHPPLITYSDNLCRVTGTVCSLCIYSPEITRSS